MNNGSAPRRSGEIHAYMDDLIIFSEMWKEHINTFKLSSRG